MTDSFAQELLLRVHRLRVELQSDNSHKAIGQPQAKDSELLKRADHSGEKYAVHDKTAKGENLKLFLPSCMVETSTLAVIQLAERLNHHTLSG